MTATTVPLTLGDLVPAVRWRSAALILGGALLTAACAQVEVHLGFTPVPITGQTFAVLLTGASLGWWRGAASQGLYWVLGLSGLPFYAGGDGGWQAGTGTTLGYFAGFVVAAAAVGFLAERRQDRRLWSSLPAMLTGTALIYVFGVAWLAIDLGVPVYDPDDPVNAVHLGLAPFVVGDLLKLLLAGAVTPAAWRLAGQGNGSSGHSPRSHRVPPSM